MSDNPVIKFSLPGCPSCGYYFPREYSCSLVPEHRDILCPFHNFLDDADLEGGDFYGD